MIWNLFHLQPKTVFKRRSFMSNFTPKSSDPCYLPHGHLDGPSRFQLLHWYAQTPWGKIAMTGSLLLGFKIPFGTLNPITSYIYIYTYQRSKLYPLPKTAQSLWRNPPSCHLHQHSQSKSAAERYRQGISSGSPNSKTVKSTLSHRIHGTGIFIYMNGWFFMVNVGNYTSPMDCLGLVN